MKKMVDKVKVDINSVGMGTIQVGDRDVSNVVRGFEVSARAGGVTTVRLEIPAPIALDILQAKIELDIPGLRELVEERVKGELNEGEFKALTIVISGERKFSAT